MYSLWHSRFPISSVGCLPRAPLPRLLYRCSVNTASMAVRRHCGNCATGYLAPWVTLLLLTLVVVLARRFSCAVCLKWYLHDPFKFSATADMLRITFPYLLFISMTGVAGILNSYDRFAVPAFTPFYLIWR